MAFEVGWIGGMLANLGSNISRVLKKWSNKNWAEKSEDRPFRYIVLTERGYAFY